MLTSMGLSHAILYKQKTAQHKSSELSPAPSGKKRANIGIQQKQHQLLPGFGYNRISSKYSLNVISHTRDFFRHFRLLLVYASYIASHLAFRAGGQKQQLPQRKPISDISPKIGHDEGLLIATLPISEHNRSAICKNQVNQQKSRKLVTNQSIKKREYCLFASRTQSQHIERPKATFQLVTLVILSIITSRYAPTCLALGSPDYNLDTGLTGYSYPNEQRQRTPITNSPWSPSIRTFLRQLNDDPMSSFMSTMMGSLSQDQASTGVPGQQSPTWTSILTNPFGLPQQQQHHGNQNNVDKLLDAHIKKILVPRVSGTQGNIDVRENNNYHVELDEFTSSTPIGNVKFANIIASSNPKACRQLVLACHYDSKMMEGFLGAVDSAVPCAMLLRISETFNKSFRASGDEDEASKDSLGLKFIFFDGEEAFVQWTSTDSLYGSRHLAAKWAKQQAPAYCKLGPSKTELSRIELFVLLDLIGSSDTSFVIYNTRLRHHYEALQGYEKAHLQGLGLDQGSIRRQTAFRGRTMPLDFVEDDHVPFKKRNVPILLLLAHPFPSVWHTTNDNYEAIDFPKTTRILKVMEKFVENYPKGM